MITMPGISPAFPAVRLRRHRRFDWCRHLVAENALSVRDLVMPVFVREESVSGVIESMAGIRRHTLPELIDYVGTARDLGIMAVALFPVIPMEKRCENGRYAFESSSILLRAIETLKTSFPDVGIIADPALDPFTDHGHDGLWRGGDVCNDSTVTALKHHAILQAAAGADIIAPSDMMDGRIGAIRGALDANGHENVAIMSYAAKFSSCFYGPFRAALGSDKCLKSGHKKTYHMDPRNSDEAIREAALDVQEGADSLLIKPGLPYLDIVYRIKNHFKLPTFAYHVSGEYALLKTGSAAGIIDYPRAVIEVMMAFKRAGCDGIFTYAAPDVATILKEGSYESWY